MGECGCTAYDAILRFKGPRGITYVLDIYPGCDECCSPVGVIIYAFDKKARKHWGSDDVPEIEIDRDEGTCIPIIHKEDLMKLTRKIYEGDEEMGDICEEGIDACFRDAAFEGIKKTVEMFSNRR